MNRSLYSPALLAFIALLGVAIAAADETGTKPAAAEALSSRDTAFLERLLKEFVFDPQGAEFVSTPVKFRTVWASEVLDERRGWRVAGKKGEPDRIVFADGESMNLTADQKVERLDFISLCRQRYDVKDGASSETPPINDMMVQMRRNAAGNLGTPDLINAAWLYRLGEEKLATKALRRAREDSTQQQTGNDEKKPNATEMEVLVTAVKDRLATEAFLAMVHAYMVRADDEALSNARRILTLYPDQAKKQPQVAAVIADLERRKQKGTFGKAPSPAAPKDYDSWDIDKKIAFWVDSLDEVDARQWGQPGGVPLAMDQRVEALIKLGDAAIPALIDTVEKDQRLTRSVHFWRDFAPDRTVLGVREAALAAAMSILRIRVFEPVSTGDNFTSRGEAASKEMANQLRAYWKKYGGLPFDERMMKVLKDPNGNHESWCEAATNLAEPNTTEYRATTVFSSLTKKNDDTPNPVIEKFKNPTVAEAIVAAMDRDLAEQNKESRDYDEAQRIYDAYLDPLMTIGDKRIAPELVLRYKSAVEPETRRKFAFAALRCGNPAPMKELCHEVERGSISLLASKDSKPDSAEQPKRLELCRIVGSLIDSKLPEADDALQALTSSAHPLYSTIRAQILDPTAGRDFGDGERLFGHPFCLEFLRNSLNDTHPTGTVWGVSNGTLKSQGTNFMSSGTVPDYLADSHLRLDHAEERECDRVAVIVNETVLGMPLAHPLLKDHDTKLQEMKRLLDLYRGHFRFATGEELEALHGSHWGRPRFIPAIMPLGKPATASDVSQGKAIFELQGKGKVTDIKLPAIASLRQKKSEKRAAKSDDSAKEESRSDDNPAPNEDKVIVVQAETDSDGVTHYGVIGGYFIRAATADELSGFKPIPKAAN